MERYNEIQPHPGQKGQFRLCGRCILCQTYYNDDPSYKPPSHDPSQKDPRIDFQNKLNTYIESIKTATFGPSSELLGDEYMLSCTCSIMKGALGSTMSFNGIGSSRPNSYFITNYGRLYLSQPPNGPWHLEVKPYPVVKMDQPIKLTQEYLDILNNLLELKTLFQTQGTNVTYNKELVWMLVGNFNKYQSMLTIGPPDEDEDLDYVIKALEKPITAAHLRSPSNLRPPPKISKENFDEARKSLKSMMMMKGGYKRKKNKKSKRRKKVSNMKKVKKK